MKNNIRYFRKKRGYTQAQLAKILNISREQLNRLENGKHVASAFIAEQLEYLLCRTYYDCIYYLDQEEKDEIEKRQNIVLADNEDYSSDVAFDEFYDN